MALPKQTFLRLDIDHGSKGDPRVVWTCATRYVGRHAYSLNAGAQPPRDRTILTELRETTGFAWWRLARVLSCSLRAMRQTRTPCNARTDTV